MWQQHPSTYKGFEVRPLVYPRTLASNRKMKNADGYDIAVRISRVGAGNEPEDGRVFRVVLEDSFTDFGDARRAASKYGEEIIDGHVAGESVADL
jgi:hypothetical protein